jgi:hypothetical protein
MLRSACDEIGEVIVVAYNMGDIEYFLTVKVFLHALKSEYVSSVSGSARE